MSWGRLKGWQFPVVFILAVAAIVSRRPDALWNPQFYAEDGSVWFAEAWNLGWLHALTLPEGGYLNTLPRLVCALAILVPLKSAPLVLNWFGILIQALPVVILLSERCSNWGPLWVRGLQAVLYLALPNSSELNVTITNAHWHLALAGCLLAFGDVPGNLLGRAGDVLVMLLVGLTGPWALVLTPLVLVFWWKRRQSWSFVLASLLGVCAAIQAWELFGHIGDGRPRTPTGASFELLSRLVAGQIYVGAIWGQNAFDLRSSWISLALVVVMGTAVLVYGLTSLRLEMRLFVGFSVMVTAAALQSPLISGNQPRWQLLEIDKGARYWFFPMLALVWTLLWSAVEERGSLRILSLVCFALMVRGVLHDWRYFAYPDSKFGYYCQQFQAATPGTRVIIPIYPAAHEMVLIKRTW